MLLGSNFDVVSQMKTFEITLLEHSHPFTGQSQTASLQNSYKQCPAEIKYVCFCRSVFRYF